jgi:hypothetical protein
MCPGFAALWNSVYLRFPHTIALRPRTGALHSLYVWTLLFPEQQAHPHPSIQTSVRVNRISTHRAVRRAPALHELGELRSAAALSKHWAQSLCPVSSVSRRILCPDRPAAGNRHNGSTLGPYPAIGGFSPSLCSPWLGASVSKRIPNSVVDGILSTSVYMDKSYHRHTVSGRDLLCPTLAAYAIARDAKNAPHPGPLPLGEGVTNPGSG